MRLPKYCRNSDGRAFSRWKGKRHYFGKYDSQPAKEAYRRFIQRITAESNSPVVSVDVSVDPPLLAELSVPYLQWSRQTKSAKQLNAVRQMVQQVLDVYGDFDIAEFGPLKVLEWQQWLAAKGYSRTTVNKRLSHLKRWLRWCASREMISVDSYRAVETVEPLKAGESAAAEPEKVLPVPIADVVATLPYLPPPVASMVQVQFLCGMRPQDVIGMRPQDIDRSLDTWLYRPVSHKNQHRGQSLTKAVPKAAQSIIQPLLQRGASEFLFDPRDAAEWRYNRTKETSSRKTKRYPSEERRVIQKTANNRDRRKSCYSVDTYRQAVTRGCKSAKVAKWSPNQLRHSIATEVSRAIGEQASQRWLGHARLETTAIYVEKQTAELVSISEKIDQLAVVKTLTQSQ